MWVIGYTDLIDGEDIVLGENDTFYNAVRELYDNVEKMASDADEYEMSNWEVLIADISDILPYVRTIEDNADLWEDMVFTDEIGTDWYVMQI